MTSFVNLLSNDQWTDADIINRTEAMIASEFQKSRIDILTRKVQGQAMGYVQTEQETADLQAYQAVCHQAGAAADAARADMALLNAVMAYEKAVVRLEQPVPDLPTTVLVDDIEVPNDAVAQDIYERNGAQALVDAASVEAMALYALRHPVPEPVVEAAL